MNRSAGLPTCMSADEEDEDECLGQALTHLSRLEAMCEAVQAQQRSQGEDPSSAMLTALLISIARSLLSCAGRTLRVENLAHGSKGEVKLRPQCTAAGAAPHDVRLPNR